MTDSDSLRGDIHDPTRHHHPELRELDLLRALLRPRMTATGDASSTEALRGLIVELDGVTGQANLLHERVKVLEADLEADRTIERLKTLLNGCFGGNLGGTLSDLLGEVEGQVHRVAGELKLCTQSRDAARQTLQSLRGRLHEALRLAMDGTSDKDIFARISTLIDREGRRRPMDEAILADNESAIARLADELAAERKLACAAAEGHDHCRELLVAACSTLGSEDYDNLPHLVAALLEQLNTSNGKADRLQDRVDEQDKARVLRAAETASERNHLEGELTRAKAELHHNSTKAEQLKAFTAKYADEQVQAHIEHAKKRVAEAEDALALLGWDRAQDMTTWARSSAPPVAAARWTKICEAFGFDPEEDPPASIPAILAGDRWTNTRRMLADACANLRAPSLEVILGELVQTLSKARGVATELVRAHNNTMTMCTGCARRIAQGECNNPVEGCGDCYWLEFRDAPPQVAPPTPRPSPLSSSVQAPLESPCPKLDEPCHVRKSLAVAPQVWIIEPIALPGYVISGRNASWCWKARLGETEYALAGYGSATAAIAGARTHQQKKQHRGAPPA